MAIEQGKPSEPMSPAERGKNVDGFIGWMYDSFLALPEAVDSLKQASKGRRFNVSHEPSFDKLSFDRMGYKVSLTRSVRGNRYDAGSKLAKAARFMTLEIESLLDSKKGSDYLTVHADVTYAGNPITDEVEQYEEGSLGVFEINEFVGSLEGISDCEGDPELIDKMKIRLTKMLGLEPVDPEDPSEAAEAQLRVTEWPGSDVHPQEIPER